MTIEGVTEAITVVMFRLQRDSLVVTIVTFKQKVTRPGDGLGTRQQSEGKCHHVRGQASHLGPRPGHVSASISVQCSG